MIKKLFAVILFLSLALPAWANPVVIEGKVAKVVPAEKEIYVRDADGKKHEYYFNDATVLTKDGKPADFAMLEEGTKVKVTAEKKGKRLDPQRVEILE